MDKTTVRIIPKLKREMDIYASSKGQTLQYVINEAIKEYLKVGEKMKKKNWVKNIKALNLGKEKISLQRKYIYSATSLDVTR